MKRGLLRLPFFLVIMVFMVGFMEACRSPAVSVTASGALEVGPRGALVAPRESLALGATNGVPPYSFAFAGVPGSGADAALTPEGEYRAGSLGSTADLVAVTDASGAAVELLVRVGASLSVDAALAVAPGGSLLLAARGGKAPYAWSLGASGQGASVSPGGEYRAGSEGYRVDEILVSDALGVTALARIAVGPALELLVVGSRDVAPREARQLVARGGQPPYSFSLASDGSVASLADDVYRAGELGSVGDTVLLTDAHGQTATVSFVVSPALALFSGRSETNGEVPLELEASGGKPPYVFDFAPLGNRSFGEVDAESGRYVAGASVYVTDTLRVTDSVGARRDLVVPVGRRLLPAGLNNAFDRCEEVYGGDQHLLVALGDYEASLTQLAYGVTIQPRASMLALKGRVRDFGFASVTSAIDLVVVVEDRLYSYALAEDGSVSGGAIAGHPAGSLAIPMFGESFFYSGWDSSCTGNAGVLQGYWDLSLGLVTRCALPLTSPKLPRAMAFFGGDLYSGPATLAWLADDEPSSISFASADLPIVDGLPTFGVVTSVPFGANRSWSQETVGGSKSLLVSTYLGESSPEVLLVVVTNNTDPLAPFDEFLPFNPNNAGTPFGSAYAFTPEFGRVKGMAVFKASNGDRYIAAYNHSGEVQLVRATRGALSSAGTIEGFENTLGCLAEAKIDGDVEPDLAVFRPYTPQIEVLHASGPGVFAPEPRMALPGSWRTFADLSGDGIDDLLGVDDRERAVVALGTGDGFAQVSALHLPLSAQSQIDVAFGDLTGDGLPELLVRDRPDRVLVYPIGADGAFGLPGELPISGAPSMAESLLLTAELGGTAPGRDLVFRSYWKMVSARRQAGGAVDVVELAWPGAQCGGVTPADASGDGLDELYTICSSWDEALDETTHRLFRASSPSYSAWEELGISPVVVGGYRSTSSIGSAKGQAFFLLRSWGAAIPAEILVVTAAGEQRYPLADYAAFAVTGDFDGDGDADVAAWIMSRELYFYENDGTGALSEAPASLPLGARPRQAVVLAPGQPPSLLVSGDRLLVNDGSWIP